MFPENKSAIQPSFTLNFGESGFSIGLWCSFSLGGRDELKYFDEIDLTLVYHFKISEDFSFQAGFSHYGWYFAKNFSFNYTFVFLDSVNENNEIWFGFSFVL